MSKFTDLLENLATEQFKEGARHYDKSPRYGDRCNQRFQFLTDVANLLKGNK